MLGSNTQYVAYLRLHYFDHGAIRKMRVVCYSCTNMISNYFFALNQSFRLSGVVSLKTLNTGANTGKNQHPWDYQWSHPFCWSGCNRQFYKKIRAIPESWPTTDLKIEHLQIGANDLAVPSCSNCSPRIPGKFVLSKTVAPTCFRAINIRLAKALFLL